MAVDDDEQIDSSYETAATSYSSTDGEYLSAAEYEGAVYLYHLLFLFIVTHEIHSSRCGGGG